MIRRSPGRSGENQPGVQENPLSGHTSGPPSFENQSRWRRDRIKSILPQGTHKRSAGGEIGIEERREIEGGVGLIAVIQSAPVARHPPQEPVGI